MVREERRRSVTARRSHAVPGTQRNRTLPSGDIVQPDVLYVSTASAATEQDWIRGVPAGWFRPGESVGTATWPDLDLDVDDGFA